MKDIISFLTIAAVINAIGAGKLANLRKYFENSQQQSFPVDILPEYVVGRYVFPEVLPESENEVESSENTNDAVLYRISSGPKSPPREGKRPALIQHGIICDTSECNVNKPQIAVAYLMVDQGYDVWLGTSTPEDLLSTETIEKQRLGKFAQYILSTTEQPELLVMGYFNGTTQFFGISRKLPEEKPSSFSKLLDKIPGVQTVRKWFNIVYHRGRAYLTNRYERVLKSFDNLGTELDYIIDDQSVRNLKNTVFNAWGIVTSMVAPTLSISDFSKMINHPDVYLNTPQLITKYGYTSETYEVQTADGYILSLHRISGGAKFPPRNGKPVVLLQHGILASSAMWILAGPSKGFAYILADEGYDVWMGNSRGNTYSRNHVNLLTHNSAYWNFSWHEMGIYDLPATIDRILDVTKQQKLYFVGHSQGTTSFFVMMSEKPEYNDKIYKFAAHAPIAYVTNVRSPLINLFAAASDQLYTISKFLNFNEFGPSNALLTKIGRNTCEARSLIQVICSNSLFMTIGYDTTQIKRELIPIIMGHLPAGSSVKQFVHYGQEMNSKKFRKFDYGRKLNLEKYGSTEPPEYVISNTKIPVGLFYASNDLISDPRDVKELAQDLPNVLMYKVPLELFNHIDFMFAIDAPPLIYQPTLAFFNGTLRS